MTNNERALRGVAVGRADWTFAGADRSAEIYAFTMTCTLDLFDAQAYLETTPSPRCRTIPPE